MNMLAIIHKSLSNFLFLPSEKHVENYLKNKQDGKTLKINNDHVVKSENMAKTK